jgi:glycosyltransferase involved in cell wall biosynthesis
VGDDHQTDFQIFYVLGRRGYVVAQALHAIGVPVWPPSIFYTARTRFSVLLEVVNQLIQSVGKQSRQLVLTDSFETALLAYCLALVLRLPLIVRVRGDIWAEIEQRSVPIPGIRSYVGLYSAILRRASCVVPVCRSLGERIVQQANVTALRVKPVPISVDVSEFNRLTRAEARRQLRWGTESVILSVTNFRFPAKVAGLELLFPAIRCLLEKRSDLRWVIVGGGTYLAAFRQCAQAALGSVMSRVEIIGRVRNMPAYYAASNLLAYFSCLDALPRAVLEAQASGRVVVANPVGGVPEMIEHQATGYLTGSGDDFLEVVAQVLGDPSVEASIGAAAQAAVVRNYSPEHVGSLWRGLLTAVANRNVI